MILDDLARVEPLLRAGCTHELDASRPLADVVADLIAIASRPMTTSRRTTSGRFRVEEGDAPDGGPHVWFMVVDPP